VPEELDVSADWLGISRICDSENIGVLLEVRFNPSNLLTLTGSDLEHADRRVGFESGLKEFDEIENAKSFYLLLIDLDDRIANLNTSSAPALWYLAQNQILQSRAWNMISKSRTAQKLRELPLNPECWKRYWGRTIAFRGRFRRSANDHRCNKQCKNRRGTIFGTHWRQDDL